METSLALGNMTKPWGDMLYEEEQNRKLAILRMPQPEWLASVNAYFNRLRGNGRALISALAWFQQMEAERAAFNAPRPEPVVDEAARNWRVWQDMVENPEPYGADIGEWLELDEELRRGPKRWRVDAYWNGKVREMEEQQEDAAVRIQAAFRGFLARRRFACGTCVKTPLMATEWDEKVPGVCLECAAAIRFQAAWRGHNLRYVMGPRFTCSRCLKHGVCPTEGEDRYTWFCAECTGELWGEQAEDPEDVCDDCGEETVMYGAKVGELLLCPECIHDWTTCTRCDRAVRHGGRCDNHCLECGDELTGLGQTNGFCCGDCHYAWERGNLYDQRYM
jgi:hypothetical protein